MKDLPPPPPIWKPPEDSGYLGHNAPRNPSRVELVQTASAMRLYLLDALRRPHGTKPYTPSANVLALLKEAIARFVPGYEDENLMDRWREMCDESTLDGDPEAIMAKWIGRMAR